MYTIFLSSSGVERSAVNRFVVGSNPTWGDFKGYLNSRHIARSENLEGRVIHGSCLPLPTCLNYNV